MCRSCYSGVYSTYGWKDAPPCCGDFDDIAAMVKRPVLMACAYTV